MNDYTFKTCIDCANKQSDPKLPKGMYSCPYVKGVLPDSIVHYDTDSTECVKNGVFKDIRSVKDNLHQCEST